jgi:hypothetical protein
VTIAVKNPINHVLMAAMNAVKISQSDARRRQRRHQG